VFNSLANKIGLLAERSDTVADFYTKAKSLIEDIHALEEMRDKIVTGAMDVDRPALLELTKELHDLLHDALRIGIQTVEDLKSFQDRTWILGIR
jgi:CMP-2-keto-3-deoxyoctulosonic acid synthetase